MKARLIVLVLGVALVASCGNPTGTTASNETVDDTLTLFQLSGTPISVPTAVNVYSHRAVRAESGSNFDLVFDSVRVVPPADTQAVLLPLRVVVGQGNTGILRATQAYDSVLQAPNTGYDDSTAVVVRRGDVLLIQAQSSACTGSLRTQVYAKMVIDSIDPADSTVHLRMRVDPNCGFRSLAEGIPTS